MNTVQQHWDEIINKLKIEYDIGDVSFKTWILPLKIYDVKNSTVSIIVPLKAYIDVISKKYLLSLKVCIAEVIGEEYEIELIAEEDHIPDPSEEPQPKKKQAWMIWKMCWKICFSRERSSPVMKW